MGNQMFQYAFARALAERNGDEVVLDAAPLLDRTPRPNFLFHGFVFRGYDLDIFNIDARLTLFSRVALRFPVPVLWAGLSVIVTFVKSIFGVQRFVREAADFNIESLPKHGNFYLDGAWQSERYFEAIAAMIRREFVLREPLSARARELEAQIRAGGSIGVNVRRGDFVTVARSIKQHGFVGLEYYQQGMKIVLAGLGNPQTPHVYVFSDEIDWCRENLKFPEFPDLAVTYVGHEYAGKKFGEYLQLLAACRHFIIPNSSFAWWAAWLGGMTDPSGASKPGVQKIVVAPKRWYADGSPERGVVPSTWVRV